MNSDPMAAFQAMTSAWMDAQKALWSPKPAEKSPLDAFSSEFTEWFETQGASAKAAQETFAAMMAPAQMFGNSASGMDHAIWSLMNNRSAPFDPFKLSTNDEWTAMQKALLAFQEILAPAWSEAFERFQQGYDPSTGFEDVAKAWLEEAGDTLKKLQVSDAYVQAQAGLLKAVTALKEKERAMIETWCQSAGMPTRAEMDTLHKTVAELRRELRAMQRGDKNAEK